MWCIRITPLVSSYFEVYPKGICSENNPNTIIKYFFQLYCPTKIQRFLVSILKKRRKKDRKVYATVLYKELN
jgi:hypothetical protein